MKPTTSNVISSLIVLACASAFALVGGCSVAASTEEEQVGAAESALTPEQCDYFDVNGTIQICHQLGNGKFKILKLNEQACINAHGSHAADYVTSTNPSSPLYDPTCQGNGCLPETAPCDATLPCCDGLVCTDGVCKADVVVAEPCPCAVDPGWAPLSSDSQGSCDMYASGTVVVRSGSGPAASYLQSNPEFAFCSAGNSGSGYPYAGSLTPGQLLGCRNDVLAFDAAGDNRCAPCLNLTCSYLCSASADGQVFCN